MKYIRKTYQALVPEGKILNASSNSQNDTYSCGYLNYIFDNLDERQYGFQRLYANDNLNDLYTEKGIKFYIIWDNIPVGFPIGAYNYGTLISITQSTEERFFMNAQIYITDGPAQGGNNGVYIRAGKDANWLKLSGSSVSSISN